jgi:hypothetical protein
MSSLVVMVVAAAAAAVVTSVIPTACSAASLQKTQRLRALFSVRDIHSKLLFFQSCEWTFD